MCEKLLPRKTWKEMTELIKLNQSQQGANAFSQPYHFAQVCEDKFVDEEFLFVGEMKQNSC